MAARGAACEHEACRGVMSLKRMSARNPRKQSDRPLQPPPRSPHPYAPATPPTGGVTIDPIFPGEAYDVYLSGDKMQRSERAELIRAYRKRVPFQTSREKEPGSAGVGGEGAGAGGPRRRKKGGDEEADAFFHYN